MPEKNRRLESWKAIADYLGREVRTVIRWEKEKGLPVHRLPGGPRSGVFAYPEELDSWVVSRPVSHAEDANFAEATIDPSHTTDQITRKPSPGANETRFRLAKVWRVGSAALLLVLGLGWLMVFLRDHPHTLERITFSGNKVMAWDREGRLTWASDLSQIAPEKPLDDLERVVRQASLDKEGQRLFLIAEFSVENGKSYRSNKLYCIDKRGNLLWRYVPEFTLSFGRRQYGEPWYIDTLVASTHLQARDLWVAVHDISWWPSFLVKLDLNGQPTLTFVNSGWITELNVVQNASGSYILAGGLNNEYDSGILAVLKEATPTAASPQSQGSPYVCDNGPTAGPHRYFVFPRSELNLITGAYPNFTWAIRVFDKRFEVRTREGTLATLAPPNLIEGIYEFSSDLDVISISRSDTYWDLHRRLELEGKVHHPADRCPERVMPSPVRMWTQKTGWTTAAPPPVKSDDQAAAQK